MREVVVLLVDPASLPGRLEQVLLDKGMFVESCQVEQASGTLLVSTPDVVIAGHQQIGEVARAVRGANDSGEMRLLVMAPRGEVAALRRKLPDEVTAVLPVDLPPAAVAVRVKTVIKKSPQETVSRGPSKRVHSSGPREATAKSNETALDAMTSRAPLIVEKNVPAVSPTGKTLPHIPAIPASPATTSSPKPTLTRSPVPVEIPSSVTSTSATQRISLRVPATSLPSLRIAILDEDVTRADAISSALRRSGHEVFLISGRTGRARWHLLRRFAPQAVVVDEAGLSSDGGAWITAFRSDRFLHSAPLVAVGLESIFDGEVGEADLSHLEPQLDGLGKTEVTFLAQFGPGRELEVSLSQIGFSRLLNLVAESGWPTTLEVQSRTEALVWNVVSGSADTATLRSGATSIELGARQALDWVLRHASARVLVRAEDGLKLRGGVLVDELLKEAYRSNLPPEAAFSAPGGATSGAALEASTVAPESASEAHSFLREQDSVPPDSELPTRPIALSDIPALARLDKPLLPQLGAAPSGEPDDGEETARFDHQESTHVPVIKDSVPPSSVRRNTPPGVVRTVIGPPRSRKGATGKLFWMGAAAVLVFAAGAATWLLAKPESSAAREASIAAQTEASASTEPREQDELPAPEAPKSKPEPIEEKAEDRPSDQASDSRDDLWRVRNVVTMDDCDVLLERPLDYYTSQPEWEGEKIWKRARHQLLIGEREAANRLMCQAAFIDPDGRASVGLGEYYLANRSLEAAKEWAQYGIEQRPDGSRPSQELLGDVYSQMGLSEKAKEQWLATMKLEPDDLPKMRTVARTLARLGHKARRGGDSSLAERLFRRAATLDEDSADASGGLASALLKNGEPELAEKWARRTLSLDASSGDALLVLGDLARERGDLESARREYREIKQGTSAYRLAQERLDAF